MCDLSVFFTFIWSLSISGHNHTGLVFTNGEHKRDVFHDFKKTNWPHQLAMFNHGITDTTAGHKMAAHTDTLCLWLLNIDVWPSRMGNWVENCWVYFLNSIPMTRVCHASWVWFFFYSISQTCSGCILVLQLAKHRLVCLWISWNLFQDTLYRHRGLFLIWHLQGAAPLHRRHTCGPSPTISEIPASLRINEIHQALPSQSPS